MASLRSGLALCMRLRMVQRLRLARELRMARSKVIRKMFQNDPPEASWRFKMTSD